MDDYEFLVQAFKKINSAGKNSLGAVNRIGYSSTESKAHEALCSIAQDMGFIFRNDQVGNTFINPIEKDYCLIGSHLDSVPDGGQFDGVSGVLSGMLLLKWNKEFKLNLPISVCAFRCEESSRFERATIGSSLCTGSIKADDLCSIKDKDGMSLYDAIKNCGFKPEPYLISGIKKYIELHIEQGRVLESRGINLGIVTSIAAPTRFEIKIMGTQDHSGATPMFLRRDSLCAAADIIKLVETLGIEESKHSTVATIGYIDNEPNAINVVPGFTRMLVDIRGINKDSINYVVSALKKGTSDIFKKRKLNYTLIKISSEDPVILDDEIVKGLEDAASMENIKYYEMPSGAGHDAMELAKITSAGMLFIPSKNGISHQPKEYSDLADVITGAKVMMRYLKNIL